MNDHMKDCNPYRDNISCDGVQNKSHQDRVPNKCQTNEETEEYADEPESNKNGSDDIDNGPHVGKKRQVSKIYAYIPINIPPYVTS